MTTDLIRYDLMAQDALRGVVRTVLSDAARDGVPGEHHFYITFRTGAPGVRLSPRMREKYPDEMTIILQHQFWDLSVSEAHFEVGLSFNNVAERLLIPFAAMTGFFDPSVQFGLKFESAEIAPGVGANDRDPVSPGSGPQVGEGLTKHPGKTPKIAPPLAVKPAGRAFGEAKTASRDDAASAKSAEKPSAASGATGEKNAAAEKDTQKVVSIEAFRKKP